MNDEYRGSRRMSRIHPRDGEHSRAEVNEWLDGLLQDYRKDEDTIQVDLVFADATGQGWVRDIEGFLVPLAGPRAEAPARLHTYKLPPRVEVEPVLRGGKD
ncbi:hypothetical protein [Actinomycetospora sp. TBRC 11914]|uniref:hypothetical protein n=1 Tax=Actinomycetospora sp. TBRC 11914 TaxID=2729387 RepID=UPI00145D0F9A|nr:hypothetical protein [Actinomycetospora sp. TBRC 11914]NMO93993.1 hypothetical protein [Actinomycetospora sp. TBRC 11914]